MLRARSSHTDLARSVQCSIHMFYSSTVKATVLHFKIKHYSGLWLIPLGMVEQTVPGLPRLRGLHRSTNNNKTPSMSRPKRDHRGCVVSDAGDHNNAPLRGIAVTSPPKTSVSDGGECQTNSKPMKTMKTLYIIYTYIIYPMVGLPLACPAAPRRASLHPPPHCGVVACGLEAWVKID